MALPTEAEVIEYFTSLSNWGRWGDDDVLGTLNLITDEKRVAASRLVRRGRTVSCSWEIDPRLQRDDVTAPPMRLMVHTGEGLGDEERVLPAHILPTDRQAGASEFLGITYHGYRITHLDALSHIFWDKKMYNGHASAKVTVSHGATVNDVTSVREGIVTRGILLDVPAHRGVDWMEPGEYVLPEEIDEILATQGIEVEEGDALVLRTGYSRRRIEKGADNVLHAGRAGWHAACLPWFHRHGISMIAADVAADVVPSGYDGVRIPIHAVGIAAMGLWLLDNCNLEPLAAACAEYGTHAFEWIIAPLPFVGATGSPVNPLAVF
jgi:kynurenine formamidase